MTKRNDLTHTKIKAGIRTAMASGKPGYAKLVDGMGLYLRVSRATGAAAWCFEYKRPGLDVYNVLGLGSYTTRTDDAESVAGSIKYARDAAEKARQQLREGTDPGEAKDEAKQAAAKAAKEAQEAQERAARGEAPAGSFRAVAAEFAQLQRDKKVWSTSHARKWASIMDNHCLPAFGALPCGEVKGAQVLKLFNAMVVAGRKTTAKSMVRFVRQIYAYAIAMDYSEHNPAADVAPVATVQHKPTSRAAAVTCHALQSVLRRMLAHNGTHTPLALMCSAWTMQRPGNVGAMEWAELDLDAGLWTIPSLKLKRKQEEKRTGLPHIVPIPRQMVEALRAQKLLVGASPWVFPSINGRSETGHLHALPMTRALRAAGIGDDEQTAHGFRASGRTLLERLGYPTSALEAQLAHISVNKLREEVGDRFIPTTNGTSYARATWLNERAQIMQRWADVLQTLIEGEDVPAGDEIPPHIAKFALKPMLQLAA